MTGREVVASRLGERSPDDQRTAHLDERYGRSASRTRWNRRGVWAAAGVFVAIFAAWVVWAGLDGTTESVPTVDVGHLVLDDTTIRINWQVTLPPGEAAGCALEAQNGAHGVVGWKIVDIPASDQRVRRFTEVVNTSEPPVTGLIYRCWPA